MPEFTIVAWELDEALCTEGPFYIERRANDVAMKLSREFHGPTVIVEVNATPHKRGYPKLYRMGRLHRQ